MCKKSVSRRFLIAHLRIDLGGTQNQAEALELLRQVVSTYSESDMQRLAELERLRILGRHGFPLMSLFPLPTGDSASSHAVNKGSSVSGENAVIKQ